MQSPKRISKLSSWLRPTLALPITCFSVILEFLVMSASKELAALALVSSSVVDKDFWQPDSTTSVSHDICMTLNPTQNSYRLLECHKVRREIRNSGAHPRWFQKGTRHLMAQLLHIRAEYYFQGPSTGHQRRAAIDVLRSLYSTADTYQLRRLLRHDSNRQSVCYPSGLNAFFEQAWKLQDRFRALLPCTSICGPAHCILKFHPSVLQCAGATIGEFQ